MKKNWLTIVAILFLAACGGSTDTSENTSTETENSQQVVRVQSIEEIQSTDTAQAAGNIATFTANMNIYNGLTTYNLAGKLEPADATNWPEISPDGLIYTFTIRDEAHWSNGDPVTANDYVFGWQKMVNPDTAASYAYMYDGLVTNATAIINGEAPVQDLGVKAIDDKTFEVTLEQPTSYFLDLITIPAFYPQHQETVEKAEQYGITSEGSIYNGPFMLSDWTAAAGNKWTYLKNPEYWDAENVGIERVEFQYLPETATAFNMYENDQIDIIELSGEFARQYNQHPDYMSYALPRTNYLELNFERKGLENLKIRRAIFQAIDRTGFVEKTLNNGSVALTGQVPYKFATHPDPLMGADFREQSHIKLGYDLATAQQDWQTGLDELGVNSLDYELLVMEDADSRILAEYIQAQLTDNLPGLNIQIRTVPSQTFFSELGAGNYDIGVAYWQADFGDPINFLERFHSNVTRAGFKITEVDELLEQSSNQGNDPMARWKSLVQVEESAINEHVLHVPIYQSYQSLLQKPAVSEVSRPGQSFTNYRWVKIN